jgi:hypothetical protein
MIVKSESANRLEHPTRRQAIVASAIALGGLGIMPAAKAGASADDEIFHDAESIHQEPEFKASAKRIYAALTDPKQPKRRSPGHASREQTFANQLRGRRTICSFRRVYYRAAD